MQIYLPIAEISANVFLFLAMGGAVGFLSGMFGVGGGFLMAPLLIFSGIPPSVAVATSSNQIVASSASGAFAYWRRGAVDFKMGGVLLSGGFLGALLGVLVFRWLREVGQLDLTVGLCYVLFLGIVGGLMLRESLTHLRAPQHGSSSKADNDNRHVWIHGLPLRMRFHRSRLYISVIPPLVIGFSVGLLTAVMGVGGGFIMVPAMIYLLRMPTSVVVGTSLFQIVAVTGLTTILHALENQSVDIVLALLLLLGGAVGAQYGVRAGLKLEGEKLRALLSLLVLAVCARMAYGLVATPDDVFAIISELP
jgi:uncharacterized membrane protein YfcA